MLVASGRMTRIDVTSISRKIEEVHNLSEILPVLSDWIAQALKELSVKTSSGADLVKPEDILVLTELKNAIDVLSGNFIDLYPLAKQIILNSNPNNRGALGGTGGSQGGPNLPSLVLLAGKCLQVRGRKVYVHL